MTVLYLIVRSFWSVGPLTLKHARCATLQYLSSCMYMLMRHFSWSACNRSVSLACTAVTCFDWRHVVELPSVSLTNAVSTLYQYLPFTSNLSAFLHRGEWDYWSTSWFNVTIATAVRLTHRVQKDHWVFFRFNPYPHMGLDICCHKFHAGWWATQLQGFTMLTWLNDMQAIVITRLHAMYQRSSRMLIFLSGIFLTLQIAGVVMGVVQNMGTSGSKLPLCISDLRLRKY
jgi:hypothetical protein